MSGVDGYAPGLLSRTKGHPSPDWGSRSVAYLCWAERSVGNRAGLADSHLYPRIETVGKSSVTGSGSGGVSLSAIETNAICVKLKNVIHVAVMDVMSCKCYFVSRRKYCAFREGEVFEGLAMNADCVRKPDRQQTKRMARKRRPHGPTMRILEDSFKKLSRWYIFVKASFDHPLSSSITRLISFRRESAISWLAARL